MGEKEYLMIKLGSHSETDFYSEHIKVIEQNGYVDMALLTRKRPAISNYQEKIFIKESVKNGNRLFSAIVVGEVEHGDKYPPYYGTFLEEEGANLNTSNGRRPVWIRLTKLQIEDIEDVNNNFETKSGKEIKAVLKASVPFFAMLKK